jgi:hypothetical protein
VARTSDDPDGFLAAGLDEHHRADFALAPEQVIPRDGRGRHEEKKKHAGKIADSVGADEIQVRWKEFSNHSVSGWRVWVFYHIPSGFNPIFRFLVSEETRLEPLAH